MKSTQLITQLIERITNLVEGRAVPSDTTVEGALKQDERIINLIQGRAVPSDITADLRMLKRLVEEFEENMHALKSSYWTLKEEHSIAVSALNAKITDELALLVECALTGTSKDVAIQAHAKAIGAFIQEALDVKTKKPNDA